MISLAADADSGNACLQWNAIQVRDVTPGFDWGEVEAISGDGCVSTAGELVYAYSYAADSVTVNGVTFAPAPGKQDGKYLWDWSSPWRLPDVPEDYGEFVKNLNDWRKNALKDALVYGRMLKPYETACGEYSFIKRDGTVRTFPSIRTSRWLTESGEDVTVAVNYSKSAQKFSLMTGDGKKAVLVYDARGFSSREANAVSGGINIEIPARSAMKIIIKNKENER